MDRMTASPYAVSHVSTRQRAEVEFAHTRDEAGLRLGNDDERMSALGRMMELPSLGECLAALMERIATEEPIDTVATLETLRLSSRSLITGRSGAAFAMPMTYRVFGNLLRGWCSPPRNVAANMRRLRYSLTGAELIHAPRACAYNDLLEQRTESERARHAITLDPPEAVVFRSRLLPVSGVDADGNRIAFAPERTAIGVVSLTHSLADGDDNKLVGALSLAFAASTESARATAFRGIEETEIRILFPALNVTLPGAGSEAWTGYVVARNSESGAKSWSVAAGLYRTQDGASVACEAVIRHGRHVGHKVAERMVEVADGCRELLEHIIEQASYLAGQTFRGSEAELLGKLRNALRGTVLDGDAACGVAWRLGELLQGSCSVGVLIGVLGEALAACQRRAEARPLEVMLGRILVSGWGELKAVGSDSEDALEDE